jgi:cardiolipin synthase
MTSLRRGKKYRIFRTPRFFRLFRRNRETNFFQGNRVELFPHGGDFFPAMFAALNKATYCICLEFYIIKDDETGRALAETLQAAVSRGVKVYLLYDYIGCFDTPGSYFKQLQKDGVICFPFNPPPFRMSLNWFDRRDHRKVAIIDGKTAFTGGLNIADEYAGFGEKPAHWRDLGIRIDGSAVLELQRLFRENWYSELHEDPEGCGDFVQIPPPCGDAGVMIINGGPHHNRSFIRSAFRMAIAGASEEISIINPYFVPGPRIVRSLLRAAGRGVKVRLLLPAKNDVPLVRLVSRSYYAPLMRSGIEIYELEGTVLHAKVMLIDGSWSVIGSANLDQRSFHRNFELNVIVDSRSFGQQVAAMINLDLTGAKRIELAEHERRGWHVRLLERLFSTISWFL